MAMVRIVLSHMYRLHHIIQAWLFRSETEERLLCHGRGYCGAHLGLVQCVPKEEHEYGPIKFPGKEVTG